MKSVFERNKVKIYQKVFSIFLNKIPSKKMIKRYLKNKETCLEMKDFVGMNLNAKLFFITAISVIDCVDLIIEGVVSNDNFKDYSDEDFNLN